MPVWDNQILPELAKLQGFDSWKKVGIMHLHQLYDKDVLLPFATLVGRFNLSQKMFYQYLQLRHALQGSPLKYNPST